MRSEPRNGEVEHFTAIVRRVFPGLVPSDAPRIEPVRLSRADLVYVRALVRARAQRRSTAGEP